MDRAYLTNVSITPSLTAEVDSTNRTDDVFVLSLKLVDEVTLFVFEVEITLGTVIVQGFYFFVLFHLLN